ncbi:MBL fold metallo-hydrolase [Aureispira anguillae]|uniref:MBL fold metallo-hydrolase n=1 Tax=Aureispira anguillae TaxID=2864201 RepID=A0A915YLR2_9BACT|nr:MBL fold metallo-hydrolase [Aureispira anguillae]BDS15557.1 MBL fold metallo-hydrolase [Aureispira anguillae]
MKIEQIYTGCLAHGAYYIESEGEAVIIDPLRETKPYIERAAKDGATIKYILETHFHADFVSGHIDLAEKTGATIVYGPNAEMAFEAHVATDDEILKVGNIGIKVLHTPGHTMESSSFLLIDETGKEKALFSGDTLFIGDVGRPDLAVKTDLSREDLAAHLYDSLRNKIMTLPDDVIVYPAHGAGSACGKNMSKETFDTLGNQKATNYALRANMTKEEFVKEVLSGLTTPPQYFPKNALMNKNGYESIDDIYERGVVPLSPEKFEAIANEMEALILDTRAPQTFKDRFIPNAINIGIDGSFAPWVGALIIDLKQPIILVTDENRAEEVVTRLARVGYDNVLGYLEGGMDAWTTANKETDAIHSISAESFAQKAQTESLTILDVRAPNEYLSEHVLDAQNFPLNYINDQINSLDKKQTYHIHCAGGYRSMITASILRARGFEQLVDVAGGFEAIAQTDIPKSEFVCPSTLA